MWIMVRYGHGHGHGHRDDIDRDNNMIVVTLEPGMGLPVALSTLITPPSIISLYKSLPNGDGG